MPRIITAFNLERDRGGSSRPDMRAISKATKGVVGLHPIVLIVASRRDGSVFSSAPGGFFGNIAREEGVAWTRHASHVIASSRAITLNEAAHTHTTPQQHPALAPSPQLLQSLTIYGER